MGHMKDLDRRIRQGGDDAIAAVGELLPRWISVEDRLPEDGVTVLALWSDDDEPTEVGGYELIVRKKGAWFFHSDENLQTGHLGWSYTHWMPLPEPPTTDTQRSSDA